MGGEGVLRGGGGVAHFVNAGALKNYTQVLQHTMWVCTRTEAVRERGGAGGRGSRDQSIFRSNLYRPGLLQR